MVIDIQQKGVEYRVHSVLDHFGREQIEEVVCQNKEKNLQTFHLLPKTPQKLPKRQGREGQPSGAKAQRKFIPEP